MNNFSLRNYYHKYFPKNISYIENRCWKLSIIREKWHNKILNELHTLIMIVVMTKTVWTFSVDYFSLIFQQFLQIHIKPCIFIFLWVVREMVMLIDNFKFSLMTTRQKRMSIVKFSLVWFTYKGNVNLRNRKLVQR